MSSCFDKGLMLMLLTHEPSFSVVDHAWFRLPFTPAQWIELEQQSLIYKCIKARKPIPSNLLNCLGRRFSSTAGLTNILGWKGGKLCSGMESTRCRRTDGKKWRCSNEAVAEQKYCLKHINRNQHRSRKLVEKQPGSRLVCRKEQAKSSLAHCNRTVMSRKRKIEPGEETYQDLLSHFKRHDQLAQPSQEPENTKRFELSERLSLPDCYLKNSQEDDEQQSDLLPVLFPGFMSSYSLPSQNHSSCTAVGSLATDVSSCGPLGEILALSSSTQVHKSSNSK